MELRKIESGLAWFTLVVLVIYFPVETWASLPHGLWSPFYIVDLIAMALLLWGAVRSLRARPERSPAILCAAYAWTVANGWRATFGRLYELLNGGTLRPRPCRNVGGFRRNRDRFGMSDLVALSDRSRLVRKKVTKGFLWPFNEAAVRRKSR